MVAGDGSTSNRLSEEREAMSLGLRTWTPATGTDGLDSVPISDTLDREVAMASRPVIHCQGVAKTFQGTPAVRDVSLLLEQGEILALVGPSGCGKTTLLRLVAGFESPDTGTITLDGRPVSGRGSWVSPEARQLGMVFQDYALFPNMTVVQNIAFGLGKLSRQAREDRVGEMLEMVRLNHLADRYPHQLSGGEQQRVALARSLAPHPLALLLDEPFSSLDPQLRAQLREEVKNILQSSGVTTIYVTHDQEEALFMGDKVAVMTSGSLEQVGTPEDIFHHPKTRFVANFLGIADFIVGRVDGNDLVTEIGVVHSTAPLDPSAKYEVMIRPDDIALRPSDTGMGRVVGRVFRGMHYIYTVSLPSGVVVSSLQHHTAYYQCGDPVDVYLGESQTLTCFVNNDSAPDAEPAFIVRTAQRG